MSFCCIFGLCLYVHVPCNVTVLIYNVVNCNMFTNGGNCRLLDPSVLLRLFYQLLYYLSRTGKRKEGRYVMGFQTLPGDVYCPENYSGTQFVMSQMAETSSVMLRHGQKKKKERKKLVIIFLVYCMMQTCENGDSICLKTLLCSQPVVFCTNICLPVLLACLTSVRYWQACGACTE